MAAAVDAVVGHVAGAVRRPVRPWMPALAAVAATDAHVVHVFPSLRARALVRDGLLVTAAVGRGLAAVVHLHGWDPVVADAIGRAAPAAARLLAEVDAWAVLIDAHRDALVAWGVPVERIHRVCNAVDPARTASPPAERPRDAPTVAFVGRLVASKRAHAAIDAVGGLPGVRLVIAGDGPERAALAARIASAGLADRVSLAGWLDPPALRALYGSASALVLPSDDEVFPLAVAEALASGVPVVATAVGAVPELVGDAGQVVPVGVGAGALAASLRRVLDGPVDLEPARARIVDRCAPERVAASWVAIGQAALVTRRARRG